METPFVYDPVEHILICSFPRRPGGLVRQEQSALEQVLRRIGVLLEQGLLPQLPFWVWPTRDEIAPLRVTSRWLSQWSRDRAAFKLQ
jgi:hypothetical protein